MKAILPVDEWKFDEVISFVEQWKKASTLLLSCESSSKFAGRRDLAKTAFSALHNYLVTPVKPSQAPIDRLIKKLEVQFENYADVEGAIFEVFMNELIQQKDLKFKQIKALATEQDQTDKIPNLPPLLLQIHQQKERFCLEKALSRSIVVERNFVPISTIDEGIVCTDEENDPASSANGKSLEEIDRNKAKDFSDAKKDCQVLLQFLKDLAEVYGKRYAQATLFYINFLKKNDNDKKSARKKTADKFKIKENTVRQHIKRAQQAIKDKDLPLVIARSKYNTKSKGQQL